MTSSGVSRLYTAMKKLLIVLTVLALCAVALWRNRLELLVWALPTVRAIADPVGPNVPIDWQQGPASAAQAPGQRPPNVILILADDLGFNDVSLYNGGAGDGSVTTPNIDGIARRGVMFTNGYAANAVCAPSRAAMMTGRYSTRFGFEFTPFFRTGATIFQWMQDIEKPALPAYFDHDRLAEMPEMQALGMPPEEITIAELLRDSGYYTAHIGKWHLGARGAMRPEHQGFADSLYMRGMLYLPEDHPDVVNAKREKDGIERMVWANAAYAAQFNGGEPFEPDGYLTDYYTNEAVRVIEANRHRPFFLYLAHWGIHNPLQALRDDYDAYPHIEDHVLRVYAGMIRSLDRGVGRVLQALETSGLTDNTLVIFTSDNGGARYIGLPDINKPYRGFKLSHFEGGTHVPFVAQWPARIKARSRMTDPVHHVDLFHTIAAAAGAEPPGGVRLDGVDLMPYVRNEVSGRPHDTLFWRQGHHQSVWHDGWKLIRADRPAGRWLFNLAQDPTEQVNLAERHPQRVSELEALLAAHNAEQAAPLWPSVIDGPQLIDKTGIEPYEEGDEFIYWPN